MIIKKEVIIVLFAFCLASAIFAVMPVSSIGTYDPWLDINDDGKIDLKDVYTMNKAYATYGDPTKNVVVTNWPNATDTAVWFYDLVGTQGSGALISPLYYAKGFSTLHVLVSTMDSLGSNTITIEILAPLYDATHLAMRPITAYTTLLYTGYQEYSFTTQVPSSNFYFWAYTSSGSYHIALSCYLTWG
jgi:hypothetical protein